MEKEAITPAATVRVRISASGYTTIKDVAAKAGINPRTLRHKLQAGGYSLTVSDINALDAVVHFTKKDLEQIGKGN